MVSDPLPVGGVLVKHFHLDDDRCMALTQRDREILDFERTWWDSPAPKDVQVLERFELSATRYQQLLTVLLEDEAAMAYDPLVVRRLQRQRERRRRARFESPVVEDTK